MKVQENDSLHLPSGHLQRRDSMNSPSLAEVYSPRVIDEDIAQSNFNGRALTRTQVFRLQDQYSSPASILSQIRVSIPLFLHKHP